MSGETVMHTEILNDIQQRALPLVAEALTDTKYYLAGGTGLALQLGHRPSVDFDWFIPQLGEPEQLFQRLKSFQIDFNILSVSIETVYLTIGDVQMSFIGYAYPLLRPVVVWPQTGLRLAGTDDIAGMKLSAIASRGSRKDFIDLYYLISNFRSLEEYLRLYQQKYQNRDFAHVIRSLVYFNDAETEPEIRMFHPIDWENLKSNFETWVRDLRI